MSVDECLAMRTIITVKKNGSCVLDTGSRYRADGSSLDGWSMHIEPIEIREQFEAAQEALERETVAPLDAELASIDAQVAVLRQRRTDLLAHRAEVVMALGGREGGLAKALVDAIRQRGPCTATALVDAVGPSWKSTSVNAVLSKLVREGVLEKVPNARPTLYRLADTSKMDAEEE